MKSSFRVSIAVNLEAEDAAQAAAMAQRAIMAIHAVMGWNVDHVTVESEPLVWVDYVKRGVFFETFNAALGEKP